MLGHFIDEKCHFYISNVDGKPMIDKSPRYFDQGFIAVNVYYFQISNKKEQNIILRVINCHMSPIYIDISYIYIYIYIYTHTHIKNKYFSDNAY